MSDTELQADIESRLIRAALAARARAYAPYSNFLVGAALLTDGGEIFAGCNVENRSYGLTICAERAALVAAVGAGSRRFTMLALATNPACTPCGACREVLAEFAPQLPIVMSDADSGQIVARRTLDQLLPDRFDFTPPAAP